MNSDPSSQPTGVPVAPVDPPAWHSRGYLPHFEGAEAVQHVAFHLADSLPKGALDRLEEEIGELPIDERALERRKQIEAWIDAGHGSCALRDPRAAAIVQDALLFFDAGRYRLIAWAVMPNHVHALFQSLPGWTVAQIVASWKKFTARKISASGTADLQIGSAGKTSTVFWHREYWDRCIRNERHFRQAVQYIHENPVKAGLVSKAEDWCWSSAYGGRRTPLEPPISRSAPGA
jgi:REP element-mobilizing transposase RayT